MPGPERVSLRVGIRAEANMKRTLQGLCGAGVLLLPLAVWAAPVVEDLSAGKGNFYQQTQAREEPGGNLVLFNQLKENQRTIKELRGQLEELRYQLEQQKSLSQERYLDLEKRIDAMSGSGSGAGDASGESGASSSDTGNGASSTSGSAASGDESSDSSQAGRQAYQAAFAKVQARDFQAAIQAFEAFVKDYPQSPLRPNGYYWLGELYSARSELDSAAKAFNTVIESYPQSGKVPDALYKLGLLKARQGKPDAGKELLTRVVQDYPDSNAAGMAQDFLNQSGL